MLEGPTSAGMIVSTAERGGTFREAFDDREVLRRGPQGARRLALLDEIVSSKPEVDRTRAHSPKRPGSTASSASAKRSRLVEQKASPRGGRGLRRFVDRRWPSASPAAKSEGEQPQSDAESAAIAEITTP